MGRRATPTPPPPPPPPLAPQSQTRYFLRNSSITPEPAIKKEPSSKSSSPSPQCRDHLSVIIPHSTNNQLHHLTAVSVQETESGMYTRLGVFENKQVRHHYDIDDSPANDWSSTSDLDDDGDTFSDEDAMVAFLERQELELRSGSIVHPSREKSLWLAQKTPYRTRNIPLLSNKRGPHTELHPIFGYESEGDNPNIISSVGKSRFSRKTQLTRRQHRGSSCKRTRTPALEWLGPITFVGFICFAALFMVIVFTSARRDSRPVFTAHDTVTQDYKTPLRPLGREWTWAWMTRPRVKDDDLLTLQYVQDLEQKLERVQQILQRIEGATFGHPEQGHEDASPSTPRTFSTLETKAISDMIEEALGADIVAKPDFALYSAGGRVLLHLTKGNFEHSRQSTLLGRLGAPFLVPSSTIGPTKALQPGLSAGECWAIQGNHGELGIRLSRKIIVTDVTIEHVDHRVAMDIGSAPRQIEIWRLPEPDIERAVPLRSTSFEMHPPPPPLHRNSKETDKSLPLSPIKGSWWDSSAPQAGAILLTSFEYQIKSDYGGKVKRVQTFSIPERNQDEATTRIVVRIQSNWGHSKHTCLYRVRVHGLEQ